MPELRKDPVTGRWVIIATDRARRPSDFSREPVPKPREGSPCPFCYGAEHKTPPEVLAYRQGGGPNQSGWTLRVVPNKFPALEIEGNLNREGEGMFDRMNGLGAHEVIVESPSHSASLIDLSEGQVEDVLWACRERIVDLKRDQRLRFIVVFKNHGSAAGASIEHSHCQLIALPVTPKRVREEIDGARGYFAFRERCVFCDIIHQESNAGVRMVTETEHFAALEPYAPRFPFETWILPKAHQSHFEDADASCFANLAWVLKSTLRKLDKVLEQPAYNFVIHSSPIQEAQTQHYHWHIEIIPRLTRIAGFEWATGFYINPTPPEEAAKFLREVGV